MALSSDNGIEEGLQKITTKISDLDYKIDTIMKTGDKNAAPARDNSLTAILKSFQDIKKEHAQLSAEMEKFKAEHNASMEEILNAFHEVSVLEEECNNMVKHDK